MNDELMHWGILKQKWGVRRFQNPDGSLTPAGRERYGVGPAKNSSTIAMDMPDEELKKMTKRYRYQADFYRARNDYIEAQNRYAQLTQKPPSFISKFARKFISQPLENVLQDSSEFGMKAASAALVESVGGKYADDYVNYIMRRNNKNPNQNNPANNTNNSNQNNSSNNTNHNNHNHQNRKKP